MLFRTRWQYDIAFICRVEYCHNYTAVMYYYELNCINAWWTVSAKEVEVEIKVPEIEQTPHEVYLESIGM